MSLIRQVWLVVLATVVLAFAGSFAVTIVSARHYVQTQLRVKNSDNAAALALSLSQQGGDWGLMELLVAAQFDTGHYQEVSLYGVDGRSVQRQMPSVPMYAPAWFVRMVPLVSEPGVAQVSDGWRAIGTVRVVSHAAYAYRDLWRATLQAGVWLAAVGVLAGLAGHVMVAGIRRPLRSTVRQAQALVDGRYLTVEEPKVPELRRLTQAMNAMVQRVRQAFEEQARQVEVLRRQASCDALTGLWQRQHFLRALELMLERDDAAPYGALVLVRMLDLAGLNARLGRRRTDELIVAVAQAVQAWGQDVADAGAGRLNGSDLAVMLPNRQVRSEEMQSWSQALRRLCEAAGQGAAVALACTGWQRGQTLSEVLVRADEGLAHAEASGPFGWHLQVHDGPLVMVGGQGAWKHALDEALAHRRVRLGRFPLRDAKGGLVHWECPLRLQLVASGPFEPAASWLPLALRTLSTSAVDLCAVDEALREIRSDGRPRGVNVAAASLQAPGFVVGLRDRLDAAAAAAQSLWLDFPETAAWLHPELVRDLAQRLKGTGVRLGLEHAGEYLARIERLYEMGLDFIKIDARFTRGVASQPEQAQFVRSTVVLAHGLGLSVFAEGVARAEDLAVLWDCGVDGATGPAVES
ncbi:LapD/MoxY N-terminal periplasmic domain-containing protein [Caldimonas sp.]|uniref:bifunctional diguanylate cyclase/phosphodiesterase n=1 Tax=Caldimonas sp. TaxID=2838790 RepID=UPI00307D5D04